MIVAQLSDTQIVAPGKLLRCPVQGTAPNAERVLREFNIAQYLARAVAALSPCSPRGEVRPLQHEANVAQVDGRHRAFRIAVRHRRKCGRDLAVQTE